MVIQARVRLPGNVAQALRLPHLLMAIVDRTMSDYFLLFENLLNSLSGKHCHQDLVIIHIDLC